MIIVATLRYFNCKHGFPNYSGQVVHLLLDAPQHHSRLRLINPHITRMHPTDDLIGQYLCIVELPHSDQPEHFAVFTVAGNSFPLMPAIVSAFLRCSIPEPKLPRMTQTAPMCVTSRTTDGPSPTAEAESRASETSLRELA